MRHEIEEIPGVVARILQVEAARLDAAATAIRAARPSAALIVARGTSDHAGIYARYLLESELGLPVGLAAPSITTVYRRPLDWSRVLLLAVSQSGASPDVVTVTRTAREGGAVTIAITNEPGSDLGAAAEHTIRCGAGPERAVAATKTYVAELAAVAALVAGVEPASPLGPALERAPDALHAALRSAESWVDGAGELVEAIVDAGRALVVSRGYNLATALEVALKLKETSRIFAEGYSSADLLHGPVALAGPAVPVLALRPDGPMGVAIDGALERVAASGAPIWLVGGREAAAVRSLAVHARLDLGDRLPETLSPLAFVLPGYLVADAVARRRGMNPDAPEGLTKVTLTL